MTTSTPSKTTTKARVIGVDVARGLALFGMMAVHSFAWFTDDGQPTPSLAVFGGRSAATFVFLAGISLAFLSGGASRLPRQQRTSAAAGIAVRALLIALIGLALGSLPATDAEVILVHYAVMFLLAIPVLWLSSRTLAALAAGVAVVGPVAMLAAARAGLDLGSGIEGDPNFIALFTDPVGMLYLMLFAGAYPVLAYVALLFAGLAVGRIDLTGRLMAVRLLVGGLALAIAARLAAAILLYPLGGLDRLVAVTPSDGEDITIAQQLLWAPQQGTSWWYLALPSPHANTPLDLAHTLGSAMAVLGAALLVTRIPAARRALQPMAAVGGMTLTLYSAHIVLLSSGLLEDYSTILWLIMVGCSIAFAWVWRRRFGQGPLERPVAAVASRARRAVARRAVTEDVREAVAIPDPR